MQDAVEKVANTLKLLRGNPEKERAGVKLECPLAPGVFVWIARMGSAEYDEEIARLLKPHRARYRRNIPDDVMDAVTKEAVANCICKGWEGISGPDGKDIPYSPEKALELFKDKSLYHFYRWIITESNAASNYEAEEAEESVKN